jgi:hypothetical protein
MTKPIFANDFGMARQYFLDAAHEARAAVDSYTHPLPGRHNEPLTTDVAWLGRQDAPRVLVMASGTHGVEGYCGSGAQVDWLRRGEAARLPAETAALLIHAINPYGFAWSRRVTHENVDLNRNWIDFNAGLPESPGYDEVADLLAPAEWNESVRDRLHAAAKAYDEKNGRRAFQQSVTGGQYTHQSGLFYGGTKPTWSRDTLTKILTQRLSRAQSVGIIDYHSGLGAWGYGELISTAAADSPNLARAREWYGARVLPIGVSSSAAIGGDWVGAVPELLKGASVTGIALEFGTVDVPQVLDALVADNWLHSHGAVDSPEGRAIEAQLRAAFYPDSDIWKGMILGQSLVACRQAVLGLQR